MGSMNGWRLPRLHMLSMRHRRADDLLDALAEPRPIYVQSFMTVPYRLSPVHVGRVGQDRFLVEEVDV